MARIRTIKPEFPQSESMGRVSRDARLLFVMLWPICDDHGRTRAASRMLASLLFPYDDDAPGLIDSWLEELEREGCITRYSVNGSTFLQVNNWLIHQKIDKPSKPQFPEPTEGFASIREDSSLEGKGREGNIKTLSAGADSPAQEGEGEKGDQRQRTIPVKEILAAYHEHLPMMPAVRVMTEARKRKLKARWVEDASRQTVEYWQRYFAYVAASDFLTGRDSRWTGCDFEWLIEAGNHVKVIEGKYENREAQA
jgi:hypothetical protein